jgi:predicted metal-dependent hydrolase
MKSTPIFEIQDLVVRTNLDFTLSELPKYWFGGDPFKSRFFDALGLSFPDGEKYFIQSVRAFRDKVTDKDLQNDISDFIKQEAQHGIAHNSMNDNLESQGIPVKKMLRRIKEALDYNLNNKTPEYNLAVTVAFEHATALMAESFFSNKSTFALAHPYARALWAWHTIEEMEHREVAFEVMKQVGNVSELTRKSAFLQTIFVVFYFAFVRTNAILRYDGFNRWERFKLMTKGMNWIFGPKGFMTSNIPLILDGFKKNFHPTQHPIIAQYEVWLQAMEETNDPIYAGNKFWEAGK